MALTTVLMTLVTMCILVIVAVGQLEEKLLNSPLLRLIIQLVAMLVMCLSTLVMSALFVWQLWLRWTVKVSDGPSAKDIYAEVIGVRLDPAKGLVMDVYDDGRIVPTLVNPQYWNLLPSSVVSKSDGLETPVLGNMLTDVKSGCEPSSLVCLSDGEHVVGMGSRIKYMGRTYLLTANHVWNGNSAKMFIAKHGIQVEVSLEAPISFGSTDLRVDFVLVEIDLKVWSRLGVSAANLSIMEKQSIVTIYGGTDTLKLTCSSGRANKGEYSHDIIHTCTTVSGWSGSPLYHKGSIVGIHAGSKTLGVVNRGVNVGMILAMPISHKLETVFSEISNTRINEDEAYDRDYDFIDVEIIGRGRIGIGRGEFYIPDPRRIERDLDTIHQFEEGVRTSGKTLWADDLSGDTVWNPLDDIARDPFFSSYRSNLETLPRHLKASSAKAEAPKMRTLEAKESHLNYQRVEAPVKRSPPSSLLESTNGTSVNNLPPQECQCLKLADRVSNLEKLIEKLLVLQSSPQPRSSQNSQISDGPSEAPKPNSDPSCSRPAATKKPRHRKTSGKPVTPLSGNIQKQEPEPVCEGKIGTTATSRRRLRRSAKATSTSKPPPVSH